MFKRYTLIVVAVVCAALLAGSALARQPQGQFVPGQVIVKFKPGTTAAERAAVKADLGGSTKTELGLIKAEVWTIHNHSVEQAIAMYEDNGLIEYIEPDYEVHILETPNDPLFNQLWGLNNTGQGGGVAGADIDALRAWDVFTGSGDVLVSVIDTGIDYTHPDLAANAWTNPGEIPGNGIDDDGNGYIDDVHGWDFYNNDNDPMDDHGHGTHCSGTIGGIGNNGIGVAGVNWTVKIMGVKFLSSGGSGSTSGAISAIQYATLMHAKVMSNSWGGGGFSQALMDAIQAAYNAGILFIAAAGNGSTDTDVTPNYPSCYAVGNVISVAATDHSDLLADFSNWGLTTVDLAAPGVDILSLAPGNQYATMSGTSMATPHVAGVAALVLGRFPGMGVDQAKALILNSVDHISSMAGKCVTGGRLNAFNCVATPDSVPPAAVTDLATTNAGSNTMDLTWTATGDDGLVGTASYYDVRYSLSEITEENFLSATRASGAPDPHPSGTPEGMTVTGLDFETTYYFALKAVDEYGNASALSNVPTGTTLGIPHIAYAPDSMSADLISGGTETQTLTVSNVGEGTLDFEVPQPTLIFGTSRMGDYIEYAKDATDPRVGDPVLQGRGGPDATGYRWMDNEETGGPVFDWVDITGVGTNTGLNGDDQNLGPFPIGFSFEYYGNTFTDFKVCSNGWMSFTSSATAYSNQALPNSGAPENLVAPFWDDLTLASGGSCYYYNDGTKLIVEWYQVPHYSTGGPYTFEAIIYPTGEIIYQYLSMADPTNSATVGTQNAAKTDGLNIVFNNTLVYDGLALRIARLPQWLSVAPTSGRVLAGMPQGLSVMYNSTGLLGGYYNADVVINSNDPDAPAVTVPVTLHVTGAPDIAVSPTSLDFGEVFVNFLKTMDIVVSNPGTDALNITGIASDNADFDANPKVFTLAPRAARTVTVGFRPSVAAPRMATLSIASNDPDEPVVTVACQGVGLVPPSFSVSPESLYAALFTGQAQNRTLTLTNNGGSNLNWNASVELYSHGLAQPTGDYQEFAKGEEDPRTGGPVVMGKGGPDVFGYRWIDSDEAGGPTYQWVDITTIGTQINMTGDDANSGALPIGFSFPFYGNSFSTFRMCTNGWVSFSSALTAYSNQALPNVSTSVPENLLAVFWDDLNFSTTKKGYYYYDGSRCIIEFYLVPKYGATVYNTFEIILYPNGTIIYQYQNMPGVLNSATVGMQNGTRTDGLQMVFNGTYLHSNMAIKIATIPEWLSVNPKTGTIPAGGHASLTATFNATDLFGGDYVGAIHIDSNDPNVPRFDVPADLHVTGAPDIAVSPTSINYGNVYLGFGKIVQLEVINRGTDLLTVRDIVVGSGDYSVDINSFQLDPGQRQLVNVRFAPTAEGDRSSTLTVRSDDPDSPNLVVPLTGAGLVAPVIAIAPSSFSETLHQGGTASETMRLSNNGGSDLTYLIGTTLQGQSVQHEYVELPKDAIDPNTSGPQIMGSGGPDVFGYRWIDSDATGGPNYDWVEISTTGTQIPLNSDDQNLGPYPIGFNFKFYGTRFTSFRACSNGWLSFTATTTAYSNSALPATGAPGNLLAMFWDDLTFSTTGRAYYYYDGFRTIIEYKNVTGYSGSGAITAEVILYPSGRIVYQYQSLTMPVTSCTVGIQNATGTDGLQCVYNAAYLHDGLAISFSNIPEWLTANPAQGTILAGQFADISVNFDAAGLIGGYYAGGLSVRSNDPYNGVVAVPCSLRVLGIPNIVVEPASVNYGGVFIGSPKTLPVMVANTGNDRLDISALTIDNLEFTADLTPFNVEPGDTATLNVTFTPAAEGARSGVLSIFSNDPDTPEVQVPLAGIGLVPPEIVVTPSSLSESLLGGETSTQTARIDNTGGSDLNFTVGVDLMALSVPQHAYVEHGKDEVISGNGEPQTLGSGGPDVFGYRWIDSDQPGGPTFGWVDISTIGTDLGLNGDDQNLGPFPIGFDFSFYGTTFNSFRACSNGFLSFTSTLTSLSNSALPATGAPLNLLAPLWDDFDMRTAGHAYYYYDGARAIIEYKDVPHYSSTGPGTYTFEVILYPSGKIVYQYLSVVGVLNSCTIGIQNATGTDGLQVVYNADYVHDGLVVQFMAVPEWLSSTPNSGTVPAGGYLDLSVGFDATELLGGDYTGALRIASNDPDHSLVSLPCSLHVTGVPRIAVSPPALNFGEVYIGLTRPLDVVVSNPGSDVLDVSAISIDNSEFSTDTTPFTLQPGMSKTLAVVFSPVNPAVSTGALTFTSNDPDQLQIQVALSGTGVVPPEIVVNPSVISAFTARHVTRTATVRIGNTGGSDLAWNAGSTQNPMVAQQSYLALGKGETDPRPGVLGTGGPDAFGYRWIDSDQPGGPAYNWVDISSVGTPVFGASYDDQNNGPFNIGFTFPFYGTNFTQFRVCTNGWLSFTSTATAYTNQALPNTGAPENLLAVFWDDMTNDPAYGNEVYYYNDGSRLIVQYNVRRIAEYTAPYYSFEVIVYPSGRITYQYRYLGATLNSCTVGIQNAAKDDGLTVVYNAAYLHANMAIQFSAGPEWLSVGPTSGVIHAGEYADLGVVMDAHSLADGQYTGSVRLASNDLSNPVVSVPVFFTVGRAIVAQFLETDVNMSPASSADQWIECELGLPAGYDPELVNVSTVIFEAGAGAVSADPSFYRHEGPNANGAYTMFFRFDRASVESILPEGMAVPIEVSGEIIGVGYFAGSQQVTVIRPVVASPDGREDLIVGADLAVGWTVPSGLDAQSYDVYFSADAGATWQVIATGIAGHSLMTSVPATVTSQGLFRVFAWVSGHAVGYGTSDQPFTIVAQSAGVPDDFIPATFALRQNSPNPFSGSTMVLLDLPEDSSVRLQVTDVNGRTVRTLVDGGVPAGRHYIGWDGRDERGREVASGVYFYNVIAGSFHETKRMVVAK
jgi:subtilisin family serine protease